MTLSKFQVQRQLQLRIEAQSKYLQKIIEEQNMGGDYYRNGVPPMLGTEGQNLSAMGTDAAVETVSVMKKQRIGY